LFIVISGLNGIGKSFFVANLCRRLVRFPVLGVWNVTVHHSNSAERFNMSEPFYIWKSIVVSVMSEFADIVGAPQGDAEATAALPKASRGFLALCANLSPELQECKAIMSMMSRRFSFPETATSSKLQGAVRLNRLVDMIVALMQEFVVRSEKLLVLDM
jgi:hypothetical protein